jgi:hypothetical protein
MSMTTLISMIYWKIKSSLNSHRGEMSVPAVIGGLLILVAYLMFPEQFHSFFHLLQKMFFDALRDNFGNSNGNNSGTGSGNGVIENKNPSPKANQ